MRSTPYLIEDNYFSQGNLETKPGVYRQTTVAVGSFEANAWGLYDLQSYFDEFAFRFNRRFWPEQLFPRLVRAVATSNILGYDDLTR